MPVDAADADMPWRASGSAVATKVGPTSNTAVSASRQAPAIRTSTAG
jgi:hypothetical protein